MTVPDGAHGNTPNLYAFAGNNPVNNIDSHGLDITLTTGNRNAAWHQIANRYLHQEVCVDLWERDSRRCCWRKSGRSCFSFGVNEDDRFSLYGPRRRWLGFDSVRGPGFLKGFVYETDDQGLSDTRTIRTRREQDADFLQYLQEMTGKEDVYSLFRHNCRYFSQTMMDEAVRRYSRGGDAHGEKTCE